MDCIPAARGRGVSVYSRPLQEGKFPQNFINLPKNFKMNYAKIEFLSISGDFLSSFWGFAPRPPPGLCPWSRFAFTV